MRKDFMLIIPIYVNDHKIDELFVLNISGDLNGICKYSVKSLKLGRLGEVEHNRPDGAYKLIEKVCQLAHEKEHTHE
jgi:hypothetical protein